MATQPVPSVEKLNPHSRLHARAQRNGKYTKRNRYLHRNNFHVSPRIGALLSIICQIGVMHASFVRRTAMTPIDSDTLLHAVDRRGIELHLKSYTSNRTPQMTQKRRLTNPGAVCVYVCVLVGDRAIIYQNMAHSTSL